MTLGRRVALLLAVVAVFLTASLVADVRLIETRAALVHSLDTRFEPARNAAAEVAQGLVDQQTAQRGYMITHDPALLERYVMGARRVDDAMAELRHLLADPPGLRAAVERLESRISAWRQLGAEVEIAAVREGRFDEAGTLVATGSGGTLFDEARSEVGSLRRAVIAERTAVDRRIGDIRGTLSLLALAGGTSALGLLVLGGYLVHRWVTRPLRELGVAVREVAADDLHRQIPTPGPPELAQLGADVEAMRRRILAELDEASRAREALAQRGLVMLSLSERLHPVHTCLPPGIHVATRYSPAQGVVAGDWCDVVVLGPSRAAVVVVDVAGHGAEAGVFALRTKELALAALGSGYSPGEAFSWVAARLGDTDERFLTGVIAEIDDARGVLRYANAGHPPLLLVDGGFVQVLGLTGPLVGPALEVDGWATVEVPLSATAAVVAFSDGVVEARNAEGEEFGLDRLNAVLAEVAYHGDVQTIADRCLAAVDDFRVADRHDDVTLVVFARAGRRAPSTVPPVGVAAG